MGSADWMNRNLSHRVEAAVPVEDPALPGTDAYDGNPGYPVDG